MKLTKIPYYKMNKDKIIVLLLLTFFGFTLSVNAQNDKQAETIDISGIVYNDLGQALEGVLILNSSGSATASNPTGEFSLKAKIFDNIVFESEGYKKTTIQVIGSKIEGAEVVM